MAHRCHFVCSGTYVHALLETNFLFEMCILTHDPLFCSSVSRIGLSTIEILSRGWNQCPIENKKYHKDQHIYILTHSHDGVLLYSSEKRFSESSTVENKKKSCVGKTKLH